MAGPMLTVLADVNRAHFSMDIEMAVAKPQCGHLTFCPMRWVAVRFCSAKSAASNAILPLQFLHAHLTVIQTLLSRDTFGVIHSYVMYGCNASEISSLGGEDGRYWRELIRAH